MSERWQQVVLALGALEDELRELGLWSLTPPAATALASREPFCVDTLDFGQWLQWVFIPRMTEVIAVGGPVLGGCNIYSMGEEAFAHLGRRGHGLLALLAQVDARVEELSV